MKKPKCAGCGDGNPHATLQEPGDPSYSHIWLCGDCEYKRDNPDALPRVPLPHERPGQPLQKETLFSVEEFVAK